MAKRKIIWSTIWIAIFIGIGFLFAFDVKLFFSTPEDSLLAAILFVGLGFGVIYILGFPFILFSLIENLLDGIREFHGKERIGYIDDGFHLH